MPGSSRTPLPSLIRSGYPVHYGIPAEAPALYQIPGAVGHPAASCSFPRPVSFDLGRPSPLPVFMHNRELTDLTDLLLSPSKSPIFLSCGLDVMQSTEPTPEVAESGRPPKRKRVALACEPCRERKVKCDGTKPTCKVCEKRVDPRLQCVYTLVPQTAKQISEQEYVSVVCLFVRSFIR